MLIKLVELITKITQQARSRREGCLENKDLQRPQNLKTKTPIFLGALKLRPVGRQYDCKLSIGDKNFEATFSSWTDIWGI